MRQGRVWLTCLVLLALMGIVYADAERTDPPPTWNVTSQCFGASVPPGTLGDFDGVGDAYFYTLQDTTPGTDPNDQMVTFTVPFGSDDGVFAASTPSGSATVFSDRTVFQDIVLDMTGAPTQVAVVSIHTGIDTRWFTADSSANGPFIPVQADGPTIVPPTCPGDIDDDNDTDVFDFGTLASNFGASGLPPNTGGDLDGDGDVDVFDFGEFASDFGCGT